MRKDSKTETASAHQPRRGRESEETTGTGSATLLPDILVGDNLGRYTVRSFIGAGGMGRVFAAYDNELGRTVALKLMRPERRDSRGRTRMFREAQALARLHHPNVVTVFDVGTQDDHVFVAMELIEGETLTEWLRREKRGWREVQAVFLAAGRGLAAAHAVGIVHRDFKPQNVVVGKERVVVVDFGLARAGADDADAGDSALYDSEILGVSLTLSGEHPGTPLYMAPEQLTGGPVTAKADQYAFCVGLREALKVRPPVARDDKVPAWLQQLIARGLSPRPEDRWPSMAALLAVLGRTFWTPRRRRLAAVAAAGVVAVVGATAFSLGRNAAAPEPCAGSETLVASLWDDATQAKTHDSFRKTGRPHADATFTRVDASLRRRLRDWASAHRDACEATHVRHEQSEALLDARMACLGRARLEVAALVSLLRDADAAEVDNATLAADRAGDVAACADVAALRDAVPPPRDPTAAHEVDELRGQIAQLSALFRLGKFQDGLAAARGVVLRARTLGYAPVLASALNAAELYELSAGSLDAAVDLGYEGARVAAQARDDSLVSRGMGSVAYALAYGKRRFEAAEVAYRSALTAAARAGSPASLLQELYADRVQMLEFEDDYAAALPLSLVAFPLSVWLYGTDSYQAAQSLGDIADVMNHLGDPREARRLYERALAIAEKALGPEHPITIGIVGNAGMNRLDMLDYDGAALLYERALPPTEQSYGADDWSVAIAAHNLAIARRGQRRLPEARALIERAIRIKVAQLGPKHPSVALSYHELAEVAGMEGRSDEALADLDKAIAIQRAVFAGPHRSLANTYRDQAELLLSLGRLDEARAAIGQADDIDGKVGGERGHHGHTLRISADIARVAKRPREAIALYRRALPLLEMKHGEDGPGLMEALLGLGAAELDAGDAADALATAERAAAIATDNVVPADVACAAQFLLAQARWAQGVDRAGAVARARDARARLAALPYPTAALPRIDRWLSQVAH